MLSSLLAVMLGAGYPTTILAQERAAMQGRGLESRVELKQFSGSPAQAIGFVAVQLGVSFAVDGIPETTEVNLNYNGTAGGAITKLANDLDCTWRQTEKGDIVLSKRYTNSSDHPQFDRLESLETAATISALFRRFPDPPVENKLADCLRMLFQMMSNEQRVAASERQLRVRQLSESQQALAHAAIVHQGFGDVRYFADTLATQIAGLSESTVSLEAVPGSIAGQSISTSSAAPQALIFRWRRGGNKHRITLPHGSGTIERQVPDPLVPLSPQETEANLSSESNAQLDGAVHLAPGVFTIEDIAKQLSAETGVLMVAAPPIAGHCLLFCPRSTTARRALDLVCEALEARWYATASNKILITRHIVRNPKTISEAFSAVRSQFPPTWRAFLAHLPPDDMATDARNAQHNDLMKRMGFFESRIAIPARRRELAALEQRYSGSLVSAIKSQPNRTELAYDDLDTGQRDALVNVLVLDALDQICGTPCAESLLIGNLLPYHADPGSAFITIKNDGISLESVIERNGLSVGQGFGASILGR